MGVCTVCKKISKKKCFGCGVFYCSNECQTFDWPKHRVHCSKQREITTECNSLSSSRKMRGSSFIKNLSEETLMMNERTSPFTALAKQLSGKSGSIYNGNDKSSTNFKIGNKQYQNREKSSKNNEMRNNGVSKDLTKINSIVRKKNLPANKKSITKKSFFSENKKDVVEEKISLIPNTENFSNSHLKPVENFSDVEDSSDHQSLSNFGRMEVIGTYRESPNSYWVMDVNNLQKYEEVQATLNEECANYETTYAKIGLVCGCTFGDEWFRAKVMCVVPETTVHFIDYGNTSDYDVKVFKKLPSALESLPGLVFLVDFEEGTPIQYKTADLDSVKLIIEETTKTCQGVSRVKILEGPYGSTLKLQPVKKLSQKIKTKSTHEKSVMDTLTAKSSGTLLFMPGDGMTRYASILPDNHKEASECVQKVLNIDNLDSLPIDAVEGDYVLVTDKEGNDQRGKVTSKVGSTYYVQLIDCGNVISADKVYPLPDDLKDLIELGVKVTIEEFILPEQLKKLETCYFTVNGDQVSGKWQCILKSTEQQIVAKVLLEKPSEVTKWQPKYAYPKSGSTVEVSSLSSVNTFYVRSVDAEMEQKFLDMNMEMVQIAGRAKSYVVPPLVGELCCAKFEEDGCFYRAIVDSVEKEKVCVTFVDFGNEQATDLKDVKLLPNSLKNIPFFAVNVKLKNVSNKPWNNMIKEYLTKLTSENIELIITYQGSISDGVILREKVSGTVVNDFIEKTKDKTNKASPLSSNTMNKKEIFLDDDLTYTTIKSGAQCTLAILYINESEFETSYVFWATVAEVDNFNYVNGELGPMISDYCASVTTPYKPAFRELCFAKFEGFWYRAACAGNEGEFYKVFFVDFGNVCDLKSSSIRKMSEEFMKAPALAMHCFLKGSERLKGRPELTKKVFGIILDRMNTFIENVIVTEAKEDGFLVEIPEIEAILSG